MFKRHIGLWDTNIYLIERIEVRVQYKGKLSIKVKLSITVLNFGKFNGIVGMYFIL